MENMINFFLLFISLKDTGSEKYIQFANANEKNKRLNFSLKELKIFFLALKKDNYCLKKKKISGV